MADLETARQLVQWARAKSFQITTAESCTGGLLAGAITAIPGASDIFSQGFVTYSDRAKIDMLAVQPATLRRYGAVSQQVAREMASGALGTAAAHLAVAVTGIAGPGGSDNKPEGRVCFALAHVGHETTSETIEFSALGRAEVRAASVHHALCMMIAALS